MAEGEEEVCQAFGVVLCDNVVHHLPGGLPEHQEQCHQNAEADRVDQQVLRDAAIRVLKI